MKYYKITDISLDLVQKSKGLVADIPSANGEYVVNGREYFDRIGNGEIIEDTPIFDYFHLQSFGEEKDWECRRCAWIYGNRKYYGRLLVHIR